MWDIIVILGAALVAWVAFRVIWEMLGMADGDPGDGPIDLLVGSGSQPHRRGGQERRRVVVIRRAARGLDPRMTEDGQIEVE